MLDEPAVKATFELTLRIPSELTAVSNTMPESETLVDGGRKEVRFAPTPKMSTYLLAFVVGDLAAVEERAPNGTPGRIWATRGKEEQGRFALDTAVDLLAYLDFYFGIPYPLEKLDHIALPDFAAGAMENWGAITYREIALLFDPANSAANTRQRIGGNRGPRDGPHVVRRPGDDGVVGRPVAQRELRFLDGQQGGGPHPSGVGHVDPVRIPRTPTGG